VDDPTDSRFLPTQSVISTINIISASRHFCFHDHSRTVSFNSQTTCTRLLYQCGPSNNFII